MGHGVLHDIQEIPPKVALGIIDFVGYDLVEVLPMLDNAEITAFLGANVIFEFISIIALQKGGK